VKKKRLIDILMSKSFRAASKQFIVWIIILALFLILFIQLAHYMKESMPVTLKPSIKEKEAINMTNLKIMNEEKEIVGNITIT